MVPGSRAIIIVIIAFLATATRAGDDAAESWATDSDDSREALRQRLEWVDADAEIVVNGRILLASRLLQQFYEARHYDTLWLQEGRPRRAVLELPAAIRRAREEGLRPEDYHLLALEQLLTQLASDDDATPRLMADVELLASDAFLTLARHYADGKVNPLDIDPAWFMPATETNLLPLLDNALQEDAPPVGDMLRALLPAYPAYAALRERLALQRSLRDDADFVPLQAGPALRQGDSGPRVEALAARLAALGDLQTAWGEGDRFDAVLDAAVRSFQRRHGLDADGVVGPRTLAALNVSPQQRIEQLRVNMERWRWLPEDLGSEYILVNIASFEMTVQAGDDTVMRQPVVVGRPYRRTPVFSHRMTYLVLNPSWEVPPRLAVQDQLPLIRQNPEYLDTMGFTVLQGWGANEVRVDPADIDWQALGPRRFPYRLRQQPGPLNALGRVKFMFPNPHNVYLHDTPQRGAFASADRALSSGCIRLSDPMAMVTWLLVERPTTPVLAQERIDAILEGERETTVRLHRPLPIHLLYWTAWVENDGRVHYTADIYQRDGAVLEALNVAPPLPQGDDNSDIELSTTSTLLP